MYATNNRMDLMSLREGLKVVHQQNLTHSDINVDSKDVIYMFSNGNPLYDQIIDDSRLLIRRLGGSTMWHRYREQNRVADVLAKHEALLKYFGGSQVFIVPPTFVLKEVWADISGCSHQRSVPTIMNSHRREAPVFVIEPD